MKIYKNVQAIDIAIERILHFISSENLSSGEKLPSERFMSETWGIHRTTLRSALKKLNNINIIELIPGRGIYVAPKKIKRNVQDAHSMTETMSELSLDMKSYVINSKIIKCNEDLAKKLTASVGDDIYILQRLRVLDEVPYIIEFSYINITYYPFILNYDYNNHSLYRAFSEHNIKICEGFETLKVEELDNNYCDTLNMDHGSFVYKISGVSFDKDKNIVEYFESLSKVENVVFSSRLTR